MKVLVVTHYYTAHSGGIEIVAGTLAQHLVGAHAVTWVASDCTPPPPGSSGIRAVPMRTWNFVERATGFPFPLWGPRSLHRLWQEIGSVDIVHLHDAIYSGNWAAFVFARLRSRPVLITQHAGLIRYRSTLFRFALRLLHRTIARTLLQSATSVVFVSPVARAYFEGFVRFRKRPEVIWNGVDTDLYNPGAPTERAAAREQLGLAVDERTVLFVGRFVEAKGLLVIERLAARLPDVTWLLAGWGPIDPAAWQAPNVRVLRSLRGKTLVPVYRAANLLVLPSFGEGLPLVVQESLACGTPALVDIDTAKAVDAPAFAVSGCAVNETESTTEFWAAAVSARLANQDESMTNEIARFAGDRWSWSAAAMRYSELFDALTSRPGLAPDR